MSVHIVDQAVAVLIPRTVTGEWWDTWLLIEQEGTGT